MVLQLLNLEHDHGFVHTLEQGVGEARTAIEKALLKAIEQQELDEGPGGQAVEELLLMKATTVEVRLEECRPQPEGFALLAVLENLLGFEAAVGIVASEPVAKTFGEGVVIEVMGEIRNVSIYHGNGVD
mgnify:CR=1 FL=1